MGHLKRIAVMQIILLIVILSPISMVVADHSPTHSRWDILIVEEQIPIEELEVTEDGEVAILVMIDNTNMISITVRLDYTVPHNADLTGPAEITVQGSSIDYFEVLLSGINIENSNGETEEVFEVQGTVTSRQGLPISVPGDIDADDVLVIIPETGSNETEPETLRGDSTPAPGIAFTLISLLVATRGRGRR